VRETISRNRPILTSTVRGFARGVIHRRAELRHHVVREAWTVAKRFAAESVENIEFREIPFLWDAMVEGYLEDQQRLVLGALARGLGCRTGFEIGTNRGRTAWTLAHNNPDMEIYTLDVAPETPHDQTAFVLGSDDKSCFRDGSCGEAFRSTPEAARITQLWGDSATFDFSPFENQIDFVYVDGAHTYDYVKSDSFNAMRMLSPTGTIAWDDYTTGAGVYAHIVELAASLDRPIYHVFGTRMAIFSRQDFVRRLPPSNIASIPAV
jgi:Methyltransferase domain